MGFHIEDGTGKGNSLRVDPANRANVAGKTRSYGEDATTRGDAFNINSGLVTLTGVDEQGILYFKNNETRDFHISAIVAILGPSTGGSTSDTTRVRFYKNPTTGTLISEATAADTVSNRNFGSSLTLTADVYKGDGSATVTDGSVHLESLVNPGNRVFFSIDEVLTKGDSIAITYEPNDSNTSMKTMAAIIGYLEDSND
jgi:hypothetical protein